MARPSSSNWVLWIATPLVGVGLVALLLTLVRPPRAALLKSSIPEPHIQLHGLSRGSSDPMFSDDASLLDPTPLFLPTRWNSSAKEIKAPEPGRGFPGFLPDFHFLESRLTLYLPPPVQTPISSADAVSSTPPGAPFLGIGEADFSGAPLVARSAYVEVFESDSGRRVLAEPIAAGALAVTSDTWQPVEFMAAVDPSGLVGPLVRLVGSGVEGVDMSLKSALVERLKVGQRLPPGFYRICVGP